jgi:hypothetical protein
VLITSFCPAISDDSAKKIRRTVRRWPLHLRSGLSRADLAPQINPVVRGGINYGRFYPSELLRALYSISEYLMRWACGNTNDCDAVPRAAWERARREAAATGPSSPTGRHTRSRWLDDGSRMTGHCHVPVLRAPGGAIPSGHSPTAPLTPTRRPWMDDKPNAISGVGPEHVVSWRLAGPARRERYVGAATGSWQGRFLRTLTTRPRPRPRASGRGWPTAGPQLGGYLPSLSRSRIDS